MLETVHDGHQDEETAVSLFIMRTLQTYNKDIYKADRT